MASRWPRDDEAALLRFYGTPGVEVERRRMHKNRDGFRFCNKCDTEFPLTVEHFPKDANRKHGLGYQCKKCERDFRRPDPRKNRYRSMDAQQKLERQSMMRRYITTAKGYAVRKVASYRSFDRVHGFSCDLDADWFIENISGKSCTYCGEATATIGCDRIDNRNGHTKANVVPSCGDCNVARMDNFSHTEMFIIGKSIAEVKRLRKWREAA
jgi:hypothetical protein